MNQNYFNNLDLVRYSTEQLSSTLQFARPEGAKDKTPRKKKLSNAAKVALGAGIAGVGTALALKQGMGAKKNFLRNTKKIYKAMKPSNDILKAFDPKMAREIQQNTKEGLRKSAKAYIATQRVQAGLLGASSLAGGGYLAGKGIQGIRKERKERNSSNFSSTSLGGIEFARKEGSKDKSPRKKKGVFGVTRQIGRTIGSGAFKAQQGLSSLSQKQFVKNALNSKLGQRLKEGAGQGIQSLGNAVGKTAKNLSDRMPKRDPRKPLSVAEQRILKGTAGLALGTSEGYVGSAYKARRKR